MPEPEHVIELKDGEVGVLKIQCGQSESVLTLRPHLPLGQHGRVMLYDDTNLCGSVMLRPDPVRAAVQVERERCRELAFEAFPDSDRRARLLADIDARGEEPSGFTKGARAFKLGVVAFLRANSVEGEVIRQIEKWSTTEPPE